MLTLEINGVNFIAKNSNGVDHIKSKPKTNKTDIPMSRTMFVLNPRWLAKSDKITAATVKTITNPTTIKTGRNLFPWFKEAPSKTGKSGNIHGAAIVRTPAKNAKTI